MVLPRSTSFIKNGSMSKDIQTYERDYNDLPFEADQAYLRRLETLKLLDSYKPARMLEVGCGMKPIFTDFKGFSHMTVVEPAEGFASHARSLAEKHNLAGKVAVKQAFLEGAVLEGDELEGGEFDMILLVSLLHEVADPEVFLKKAVSLGQSGARYMLNVPNQMSFHRQLAVKLGLIKEESEISAQQVKLQQNRIFNRQNLTELSESVGLRVLDSYTSIFKPFTHEQMQKLMDQEILTQQQVHAFCSMMPLVDHEAGSEIMLVAEKI